jgi:hypothetical protein
MGSHSRRGGSGGRRLRGRSVEWMQPGRAQRQPVNFLLVLDGTDKRGKLCSNVLTARDAAVVRASFLCRRLQRFGWR